MNIYKNLLFLHGFVLDPELVADSEKSYAEGYGNRVANRRALQPLGHARSRLREQPMPAAVDQACVAGGCG